MLITLKHILGIKVAFFHSYRMINPSALALQAFSYLIVCPQFHSRLLMLAGDEVRRWLWVRRCYLWSRSRTQNPRAFWSTRFYPGAQPLTKKRENSRYEIVMILFSPPLSGCVTFSLLSSSAKMLVTEAREYVFDRVANYALNYQTVWAFSLSEKSHNLAFAINEMVDWTRGFVKTAFASLAC